MAKVVLTFQDSPDGKVQVVAEPSFETLMMMYASGHDWSSAQSMAIFCLNRLREQSKSGEETRIIIPRIGT